MAVLSGHTELIEELSQYAAELTNDSLAEVLSEGADIIVYAVKGAITESRTGTLAASIDYQPVKDRLGTGSTIGVDIGWRRKKRPGGSKSSYTDIYGPVLEYSEKRVLRHMLAGYEIAASYATDHMLHLVYKKLNKGG